MNKIPHFNLTWLLRYWLGFMLIYHSHWLFFEPDATKEFVAFIASKGFPVPEILAYLAKSIEFFGGALLLTGLYTRLVSFLIVLVLGIAALYIHKGLFWSEGELAFNYFLIAVILFFNPNIPFKLFKKNNKIEEK